MLGEICMSDATGAIRDEPSEEVLRLVRAAAAGRRPEREAVARRLLPIVRGVARALIGPGPDTDDAVQAGVLAIFGALPTYRAESSLEWWARRIVVRSTLKFAAKQRRRRQFEGSPLAEEVPAVDSHSDPSRAISDAQLPRPLHEYLRHLSERHRTVLVLFHGLGYSLEEISEITRTPVNTVKTRLLNGRKHLRKRIQRDVALQKTTTPRGGRHGRA